MPGLEGLVGGGEATTTGSWSSFSPQLLPSWHITKLCPLFGYGCQSTWAGYDWLVQPIKSWLIFECVYPVIDFWCPREGLALCLLVASCEKVSGILLIFFFFLQKQLLSLRINGSLEQKCGLSLGRSRISSLVKTRGDNRTMERNPSSSRALWGTRRGPGSVVNWKEVGVKAKEKSEVGRRRCHQMQVPVVDSLGFFKS